MIPIEDDFAQPITSRYDHHSASPHARKGPKRDHIQFKKTQHNLVLSYCIDLGSCHGKDAPFGWVTGPTRPRSLTNTVEKSGYQRRIEENVEENG